MLVFRDEETELDEYCGHFFVCRVFVASFKPSSFIVYGHEVEIADHEMILAFGEG